MDLVVHRDQGRWRARFGERDFPCAVGRGGVVGRKTEGDGATPAGCWPLRRVLFRADRLEAPPGVLPAAGPSAPYPPDRLSSVDSAKA